MCGIAGFNWADAELIERMGARQAHRGPDDQGTFVHPRGTLGHRRLSIIDLSPRGRQPMANEDGSLRLVYNGEIYNYRELRAQLTGRHTFASDTDSEVVLHAYEEWGVECLSRFNGMFAFCLFEPATGKMLLARDRVGIKPLYYWWSGGKLLFASEIKAILEHPEVRRELQPEALVDYLAIQGTFGDRTFFKGVQQVRPAEVVILEGGVLTRRAYWTHGPELPPRPREEILGRYSDAIHAAVKRHLISDVPVGVYLSGGIDSSTVACLASKLVPDPLHAFTATFDSRGHDESDCSRALTDQIGARVHERAIGPQDFLGKVRDVVRHLDEPRAGVPVFAQYHLAGQAAKEVKVVLTGHAGDELFSGYPVFLAYALRSNPLSALTLPFRLHVTEMARMAYFLGFPLFSPEARAGHFIIWRRGLRDRIFTPEFRDRVRDYDPAAALRELSSETDPYRRVQDVYFKAYLPTLLTAEDKMSMAHSLEGRVPFCDNELLDLAFSLGPREKLDGLRLKSIPKDVARRFLPPVFFEQPKRGFPTPFTLWLRREIRDFTHDTLLGRRAAERGIFQPKEVERLLRRHESRSGEGLLDLVNASRLWALIAVELWFQIFVDKDE